MRLLRYLLVLMVFIPRLSLCQVVPVNEVVVEVSKEKTIVNGKLFYVHTVKKGENIFRISKAYKVTQKDILIANPETVSGSIRDGQELKIPTEPSGVTDNQAIKTNKYVYHVAEVGQTMFFLTQKYKISKEEIIKYNPDLEFSPLQIGQLVSIPKISDTIVEQPVEQISVKVTEHQVKKRENKYGISRLYNISVDDLIAANPILNGSDPQPGQILRIPTAKANEIVPIVLEPKKDSLIPVYASPTIPCDIYKPFSETYNVAMLLPLLVEQNILITTVDSANASKARYKERKKENDIVKHTSNIIEFYQGALIALDSLKKAGLNVKVTIYDVDKNPTQLEHILAKPEMTKMDLIIGPFYTDALEKASLFALKNKIKMVSPVSTSSKALKNNPYLFQVNPNDAVGADAMMKCIAGFGNKNIILVCSNKQADTILTSQYRNKLKFLYPTQYKEFTYYKNITQLPLMLSKNVDNIIVIPTDDKGFISSAFQILNRETKNYSIKVFGLPAATNVAISEHDYLYNLEFHYYSAYYTDYTSGKVRNFITKYHHFYNTEPHKNGKEGYNFGMLGYDVTFYFMSLLGTQGKLFENCIGTRKIDLLHTNFIFEHCSPEGGFINIGGNILKYNKNYTLTKVN